MGDEDQLDEKTEELCRAAPLCAHIGEALHRSFGSSLPPEVEALLQSKGARVASSKLLKVSFHATFVVSLSPALLHNGSSFEQAIVQILGSQLGDKAIFGEVRSSTQASTLVRAMEIASAAGLRVPAVFASGSCDSLVGPLDFLIEEFIHTETVEDEVQAPDLEWQWIHYEAEAKLLR